MNIALLLLMLAPGFSSSPAFRAASAGLQPEVLTYGQNITNNSGTISGADLLAVNAYIIAEKSIGFWPHILDMSPLAGNQTNAAVVKLVVGNASPTNLGCNKIAASDYVKAVGWNNGVFSPNQHWFNTGFYQTNLPTATHGFGVWSTAPFSNTVAGKGPIGHDNKPSGDRAELRVNGANNPVLSEFGSLSGLGIESFPDHMDTGVGLWGVTRTATNWAGMYMNGKLLLVRTNNDISTNNNQPFAVMASYSANSPTDPFEWVNNPIGYYCIDDGAPTNLMAGHFYNVLNLMRALGRTASVTYTQKTFIVIGQSLAAAGGSGTLPASALMQGASNSTTLSAGGNFVQLGLSGSVGIARETRAVLLEKGAETGWRAFGDHLNYLCTNNSFGSASNSALMLNWAESGQGYSVLKPTSTNRETFFGLTNNPYFFATNDVALQMNVQSNLYAQPINVQALLLCHGEADSTDPNYTNDLYEWTGAFQRDIAGITAQGNLPPMFTMQSADLNWPVGGGGYPYAALAMLQAHENSGGSNLLVCSRYHLIHQTDAVHLYNKSYQRQGEYFAEAVFKRIIQGQPWEPVRPVLVSRSGAVITVTFTNTTGTGLVIDTNLVTQATSYGFTYTNANGLTNISSVALSGAATNQAIVTLASDPGTSGTLRYAMNCYAVNSTGPTNGSRGNIRDNYPGLGFITTSNMYNWSVMWEKSVP